jgi:hypothetical protein
MTTTRIQTNITRCIEIQRQIAQLKEEEKIIKGYLATEAESDPDGQLRTEGGGWSWTHPDTQGNIARVTQPAAKLTGKFDPDSKTFPKIREAAGRRFTELFMQVPAYKPVEDFREKAGIFLDRVEARKLLKLVTKESAVTVSFEVAQKEAA